MITVLVVPFGCFVLKRNPRLENSDKHLCSPELLTGSSRSCCCAGWVHECCWGQSWLKAPLPVPVPLPVHSAGRKRSHTTSTCHCAFVVCNPASLGSASPPPHIKWWWCKMFKALKKKKTDARFAKLSIETQKCSPSMLLGHCWAMNQWGDIPTTRLGFSNRRKQLKSCCYGTASHQHPQHSVGLGGASDAPSPAGPMDLLLQKVAVPWCPSSTVQPQREQPSAHSCPEVPLAATRTEKFRVGVPRAEHFPLTLPPAPPASP